MAEGWWFGVNRRQQLAPVHQVLLVVFGEFIGRSLVHTLDCIAGELDHADDITAGAIKVDAYEWQAES